VRPVHFFSVSGVSRSKFVHEMLDKVRAAAELRDQLGFRYRIEVDGGIGPETAGRCREAGADVFVAGHSLFRDADREGAMAGLARALGLSLR
jgi:ribulose-phosphate 3-epimerase